MPFLIKIITIEYKRVVVNAETVIIIRKWNTEKGVFVNLLEFYDGRVKKYSSRGLKIKTFTI